MNILNIEHVSKTYGEKKIFDDVSFGFNEGDKVGIIGINGMGKSSLLKMLAGKEEPDEGKITMRNGLRIEYLPQAPEFPGEETVLSYVSGVRGGASGDEKDAVAESRAKTVLNRLMLTEYDAPLKNLSGGQKKRAALARALMEECDVLILDEPTNHLDNEMTEWLEDYLKKLKAALIMVTHDRYFLDRATDRILETDRGKLYAYEGNYSRFLELKAAREEAELGSERKRRSLLRMELEWAKRGCRVRSTKQKARLQRLEELKAGKGPGDVKSVEIESVGVRMGKKTIELKNISKAYGDKTLIKDFSYTVLKNQRIGVIGKNGCGKTTLMRIINGELPPDTGSVEVGETVKIGYFAQTAEHMSPDMRVIDYIKEIAEFIPVKDGYISASSLLENFLFDAAMQYSPIGKLSGGEKRRLYLLSILARGCNVLLLDEPTNDLDIPTLTILEDYLNSFAGIVIAVSHDRYFLDNVCDKIFSFEGNGEIRQSEGGYTDYAEKTAAAGGEAARRIFSGGSNIKTEKTEKTRKTQKAEGFEKSEKQEKAALNSSAGKEGPYEKANAVKSWKQDAPQKLKFSYKEQREFETIDDEIASLEERIAGYDGKIAENATNSAKLSELMEKKEKAEAELSEKMDRWVYLNDLAERIEAEKKK